MRASNWIVGIAAALLCGLGLGSPASAGEFPIRPDQCGGYEDILDYFDSASTFTGTGLTPNACSKLCKQAGSACKASVTQASKCSKKAVSLAVRLSIAYVCKPLEGQDEKDCNLSYTDYGTSERAAHDASARTSRAQCDAIRDACIADCGD